MTYHDHIVDQPVGAGAGQATPATSPEGEGIPIRFEEVTRRFGDLVAVDEVSFRAEAGSVVGLLGHNGAGKTTIVRLIAGLLRPDGGSISVTGLDPSTQGEQARARLGVLPSSAIVDDRLTGWENIRFAGRLFGLDPATLDDRGAVLLAEFGIDHAADRRAGTYSAGMRQRLALARVLLPGPRILLLDEPAAALDPVAARELRELIRDRARTAGHTVVLCTHDLAEAETLCDEVVILANGRTLRAGPPARLLSELGAASSVDVRCRDEDRTTVVEVLREEGVQVDGPASGAIHVPGADEERVAHLVAALVGRGVRIHAVEPRRPTLADLYFALHADVPGEDDDGAADAKGDAR